MLVVGITGGVGAGKTRVLQILEKYCRCRILLADDVGNKVKEPGQECYEKILELLGSDILDPEGKLDRFKMAEKIFAKKALLERVNEIIHPAVKKYILNAIEEEKKKGEIRVFFLEAALLIEAGYIPYLDELWYIYSTKDVRVKRLKMNRGYSDEKIAQIMSNQLSDDEFRKHADVILDNSYDLAHTLEQIKHECVRLHIWENNEKNVRQS